MWIPRITPQRLVTTGCPCTFDDVPAGTYPGEVVDLPHGIRYVKIVIKPDRFTKMLLKGTVPEGAVFDAAGLLPRQ